MKKKDGVKEAAEIVSGLDFESGKRIMKGISKENPQMAKAIEMNMVSLEDLKHITVKMLQDLLKEIPTNFLGLALRVGSRELRRFILENISSSLAREIQEILNGPPRKKTDVSRAVDHILSLMRKKVQTGEIVIREEEEYV